MKNSALTSVSKMLAVALTLALSLSACAEQQRTETGADTSATAATQDTAASPSMSTDTSSSGGGVVQVRQGGEAGPHLTDASGRTLYLFKKDRKGSGESTCTGACAQAWPAFTVSQGSPSARGEAQSSMLDTLQRRDGTTQVTYNGWPLYYYAQDQSAGDLKGQDIEGFGAEWYALTPQGTELEESE